MATEAHGATINHTAESQTGKSGIKIHTVQACDISALTVEIGGTTDATKCYILDASKSVLATATLSSGVGTFASPYSLSDNTDYYLVADNNGSSYELRNPSSDTNYPYSGTYFNWVGGLNHNGDESSNNTYRWLFNVVSATIDTTVNVTVTPAALALSTTSQSPLYLITISKNNLSLSLSLKSPTIIKTRGYDFKSISKNFPVPYKIRMKL